MERFRELHVRFRLPDGSWWYEDDGFDGYETDEEQEEREESLMQNVLEEIGQQLEDYSQMSDDELCVMWGCDSRDEAINFAIIDGGYDRLIELSRYIREENQRTFREYINTLVRTGIIEKQAS